MSNVNVAVSVTSRFALDRLHITPELVGAKHKFIFDEQSTTVTLPPIEPEERGRGAALRCIRWKSDGMVPLEYQVHIVDFAIELAEPIHIPNEMLRLPPNQFDLLDKAKTENLNTIGKDAENTLKRAFDYWLRVLRWKSRIAYIGEPRIRYAGNDGAGSVLRDRATQKRLWLPPQVAIVMGGDAVTLTDWNAAQAALNCNKQPPIWFEFLFEAKMRMNNNDLVGAVLTLAIAFEVSLRKIFSAELERLNADPAVLAVIDVANLRALLTRLKKKQAWNGDWEDATNFSTLHELMDCRDRVMHMARVENLNNADLRKMYAAVEKFAYFTTSVLGLD